LITNHILWVAGLLFGIYRMVTPGITISNTTNTTNNSILPISNTTNNTNKQRLMFNSLVLCELLVALQFLVQVVFYVEIVPLKHTQYLIPIAVFVAWYVGDLVWVVRQRVGDAPSSTRQSSTLVGVSLRAIGGIGLIVGLVFLYQVFIQSNKVKLTWDNTKTLAEIADLYRKIPQNEPVLDLDGRMLYNPDSFYACCVPFGQSEEFFSRSLPSLPDTLVKTNTKFIVQGELERVNTLPWSDQQYIYANYEPWEGNKVVLVSKGF
jgi:hypothetical protein